MLLILIMNLHLHAPNSNYYCRLNAKCALQKRQTNEYYYCIYYICGSDYHACTWGGIVNIKSMYMWYGPIQYLIIAMEMHTYTLKINTFQTYTTGQNKTCNESLLLTKTVFISLKHSTICEILLWFKTVVFYVNMC